MHGGKWEQVSHRQRKGVTNPAWEKTRINSVVLDRNKSYQHKHMVFNIEKSKKVNV